MRIGIDMDDTITDTWNYMLEDVSKEFNIELSMLKEKKNAYAKLLTDDFGISLDEYCQKMRPVYQRHVLNLPLQKEADKYINKLHDEGNEIYFITARETLFYNDPYGLSKEYLTKNNIYFDKLITDAKNKEKICEKYNVDILIDDRYTTIEKVINNGKKAIIFDTNWNRNYNKSPRAHNWQEVYNYIKSLEDNNE